MKVLALIGYRNTGKDTFWKILNENIHHEEWSLFTMTSSLKCFNLKYKRIALADALKQMIMEKYSISYIESEKDQKKHFLNGELYSFRDLCIRDALQILKENPYEFAERIYHQLNPEENYMITDLRFKDEFEFLSNHLSKFKTLRLFDGNTAIPPEYVESEHQLDDHLTDYLLLRNISFEDFLHLFPQYSHFKDSGFKI